MRAFITNTFPRAERIIAVSGGARDDLVRHFSIPIERITVLENPIDLKRIRRASEETIDELATRYASVLIVGVGRLVRLTARMIISAFARLQPRSATLISCEGRSVRPEQLIARSTSSTRDPLGVGQPWTYMRAPKDRAAVRTEPSPTSSAGVALSVPVVAARCYEGGASTWRRPVRRVVRRRRSRVDAAAGRVLIWTMPLRHRLTQRGAERASSRSSRVGPIRDIHTEAARMSGIPVARERPIGSAAAALSHPVSIKD